MRIGAGKYPISLTRIKVLLVRFVSTLQFDMVLAASFTVTQLMNFIRDLVTFMAMKALLTLFLISMRSVDFFCALCILSRHTTCTLIL